MTTNVRDNLFIQTMVYLLYIFCAPSCVGGLSWERVCCSNRPEVKRKVQFTPINRCDLV